MISEPYKIKEVKNSPRLERYERFNILKKASFNTFHVSSDHVAFEMVSKGMSSWTHYQKAAYMIGDEAYAGSRNHQRLQKAATEVLGIGRLVPTHNRIGAEKLLATTMLREGTVVLHNRGKASEMVLSLAAQPIDITSSLAAQYGPCDQFAADADLERVSEEISRHQANIAYVHIETCPEGWNGQPVSLTNLKALRELTKEHQILLVVDISHAIENAWWIRQSQGTSTPLVEIVRNMVGLADVVILDAAEDPRADIGGFIASSDESIVEKFCHQVVVYEGLHTYGGMTGRAMEVFAVGIEEMCDEARWEWHLHQVRELHQRLADRGVPAHLGGKGVALDAHAFLPHLPHASNPKFALACSLFIHGGIRARLDGRWEWHLLEQGRMLHLEIPRSALTISQLDEICRIIGDLWDHREAIYGLELVNAPEYVDQALFEPTHQRLYVSFDDESEQKVFEPYKIAITEPITLLSREQRIEAIKEAGHNTFLLNSEEVYIDLLTDSGTSAQSCYQWEGMTNSNDTPYSSRHYLSLVKEYQEILGFDHIIPTHQGRAAEHIMSQCMIRPGQVVPGNMYFTTTRLHQEMAGGLFFDVIVDEAHQPESQFPWKGNIDLDKLRAIIDEHGAENVAYLSYEMSVNMAGGQPFSMQNAKDVSRLCQKNNIPVMFDATRCIENSYLIQKKDPNYAHKTIRQILREMLSYGDGCTISCKKDFLVNMGGILACNDSALAHKFQRLLRIWEGDVTNGGMDPKDIEALHRGLLDALDDEYIRNRVEQTQDLGKRLNQAGIPIVNPPGSHAIFIDAKRFLPHLDQDEYPAQALAAAIYIETGVRTMERGNVSKGRNPETGQNFRPALELVRLTIPRRVYTDSHMAFVAEGIERLWAQREQIGGLNMVYEPKVLRFFQSRFEPKSTS